MTPANAKQKERERRIGLEKARFEYCATLYEREVERKEALEKKSQFHLSITTLFLGAIFFQVDLFDNIRTLVTQKETAIPAILLIGIPTLALAASLLVSLIAVLQSMRLQSYKNEYPANVVSSLFSPDSKYLRGKKDESSFFSATALSYAIALEFNKRINDRKATWIKIAWSGVLGAAISLTAVLSMFAYLSML